MTSNFEAENLQMESYKNFMVKKNKSALLVACMRSNKHATKKTKEKKMSRQTLTHCGMYLNQNQEADFHLVLALSAK